MSTKSLLTGMRPVHPGEVIREIVLPAIKLPKAQIARLLGISRPALYDILNCKAPITPAMAVRFGKLFGNGARVWIVMQGAYDLAAAEREMKAEIKKIPTLEAA